MTVIKVTNAEELRAALSVAESASGEIPTILLVSGSVIDLPLHVPDVKGDQVTDNEEAGCD